MKKTYYIYFYKVGRDIYSHFYVKPMKREEVTGRLELIKAILKLVQKRGQYLYEISENPEPKFPVKK